MSSLVVKAQNVPAGNDPERAHIACNVAAVALASGLDVHLFLALEGARLAQAGVPETIDVPDAPPARRPARCDLRGGDVVVCTPCATRRGLAQGDFREGTVMAGSARFVELVTAPDATAVVY